MFTPPHPVHGAPAPVASPSPRRAARLSPAMRLASGLLALAAALVFFAPAPLLAHGPGENTLVLRADAENLEVVASLSLPAAAALLDAEARATFSVATFAEHRPALLAAAPRVCELLDADARPLVIERAVVSLHDAHEVRFTLLYPASARPARVRVPVLTELPAGYYFLLTDRLHPAARPAVLRPAFAEHVLPAATPAPAPTAP